MDRETLKRRAPLYLAASAAVVVAVVYTAVWHAASIVMERTVHDVIAEQRAAGLHIQHGNIKRHGFPFFWRVRVETPAATAPGVGSWRGDALEIDALPYDLSRIVFTFEGPQIFTPDPGLPVSARTITMDGARLRASISNASDAPEGAPWRAAIDLREGTIAADGLGALTVERFTMDAFPQGDDALRFGGRANAFAWTDAVGVLAMDYLDFDMTGRPTDGGGAELDIAYIRVAAGGGAISADGRLFAPVDAATSGRFTVDVKKPKPVLDAVAAYGAISQEQADAASLALGVKGLAQGSGAARSIIDFDAAGVRIDGETVASF